MPPMVVRMRVNRSKSGKRRSHHALAATRLIKCQCGSLRQNHRACPSCGKYGNRVVVDVVARANREAGRQKRREKALRAAGMAHEAVAAAEKETAKA
jgi:large subunit ribosomal protein L32